MLLIRKATINLFPLGFCLFVSMMIKYYFDLCKLELVSMLRQGCNHSICYQTVDYELCTEASVYTNNIQNILLCYVCEWESECVFIL